MTSREKETIRAIIQALYVKRDRLGRLDPSYDGMLRRKDMDDLFKIYPLPHGGADAIDKACMILQCLVGDEPMSIVDGDMSKMRYER